MPRYKRTAAEAQLDIPVDEPKPAPEHAETLRKLRNMWEFASLMQYIYLFGDVVKIDQDLDIEDLEHECLQPTPSQKLADIGLALLKYVSSHRGLTPEIFDEYTRRQYLAKAPSRNPFGDEEEPIKFNDLDVFTRISVLQQLSTWTLGNADRIRGLMPEDAEHLDWRVDPIGWDKEEREYYVLDDNRLYRRADEPVPPPASKPKAESKPKSKSTRNSRGTRSSKRRKVEEAPESEQDEEELEVDAGDLDDTALTNGAVAEEEEGYGFTSKTWECIAVTLGEYQEFMASIFRSRDPNERELRKRIEEDVLPILEKRAEALRQKQLKKFRELENMQKMATAKRSSRLAGKAEREQQEKEEREAEEKRQRDIRMAHEEQDKQRRIEEGHESRRLTREQRFKEREVKRILHEEELARLEKDAERAASQDPNGDDSEAANSKRLSERQLKTQREQHKKELERLAEEEDKWFFDCAVCGQHGDNFDDGTHSMACERCNVWQHSKCHGFTPKQVERDDFHFVCGSCKRKEEDAKKPKIPPLKLGKGRSSDSPTSKRPESDTSRPTTANGSSLPAHVQRQLDSVQIPVQHEVSPGPFGNLAGGQNLQAQDQARPQSQSQHYPPSFTNGQQQSFVRPPQQQWNGNPLAPPGGRPSSSGLASSPPPALANGHGTPNQHQAQHQNAHQNAVSASGGHPGYGGYQPPPVYGFSPRAGMVPMGSYSMGSSPPAQQQQLPRQPPVGAFGLNPQRYPQPPTQQHGHQQQRPGSSQLMNGFQSPVKQKPSSSPAAQASTMQQPSRPRQPSITQSPQTSFPPPSSVYNSDAGHSPTKSSPAAPLRPFHPAPPSSSAMQYNQTPQQLRPNQFGNSFPAPTPPHQFQTPQGTMGKPGVGEITPAPPSASANLIAADGLAGPWPEGSLGVPRKVDQSPAPPLPGSEAAGPATSPERGGASQGVDVIPPGALLTPSQALKAQGERGSVPVKKIVSEAGEPMDES